MKKNWIKVFALILVCSFVLSACSGNSDKDSEASTETTNESSENKSDSDSKIVLGGNRDPAPGSQDPYYLNVNLYVWEPLIGLTDDGELLPVLATEWSMDEDAKEWTFTLKEGVSFSDGVAFNADAVITNFERYKTMGVVTSNFFPFNIDSIYPGLSEVVKVDDYTITLTFDNPVPMLPYQMVNWGSCMFSPNCYDADTGEFTDYCIGTGQFVVSDHKADEYLLLERNDNYYGNPASTEFIEIRVIPEEETRVAALRSGEIQGVYDNNAITPLSAVELEEEGSYTLSSTLSANIYYIAVNNENYPFNDVRMRQALSMIIDRDTIVDQIYQGYGQPISHLLSPLSSFSEDIEVQYDPDKAKELAAEVLKGDSPTVRLYTMPDYQTNAELIATWIEELGLTVDMQVMDSNAQAEKRKSGDYDLAMTMQGLSSYDPGVMLTRFMAKDGDLNTTYKLNYSNSEADALFEELNTTFVLEDRMAIYTQLQEICAEDLPSIPLIAASNLVVHSNDITGYDAKYTGTSIYETEWAK